MKIYTLLVSFLMLSIGAISQVTFTIVEPLSISGGYDFTSNGDAANWGLADLNDPNDAIEDTVVLADDGSTGINAQGIPFANEACNPLINNVAGKIVMVYRYDGASSNSCYAGTKVLNAENAGAIGVIIVNRVEGIYGYDGTLDGPSTTIPFAFVSKSDGAIIRAKIDAGEDVIAFLGNKLGLYSDDVGIKKEMTLAPTLTAVPSLTAQDDTEFNFDIGTKIFNFGQNTQSNIMVTATVNGPSSTWTETVGPFSIPTGDSIEVFTGGVNNISEFSMTNYPDGLYSLDYTIDLGVIDESSFDNYLSYNFIVSDSIISYCDIDPVTNKPIINQTTRSTEAIFSACMVYQDPNASRMAAEGMYFSAEMVWNSSAPIEDEEVTLYLIEWNDNYTDLNDANFGFTNLDVLTFGVYTYSSDNQSEIIHAPFDEQIQLEDNQRYLACAEVWNTDVWLNYNTSLDYTQNVNTYLQPLFPVAGNSDYFALGFGEDLVPAIGLSVFNAEELSIDKANQTPFAVDIYPNPSSDLLNVIIHNFNNGEIIISDLTGKQVIVMSSDKAINQVNISNLESGHYILQVRNENGEFSQKKFSKI